MAFLNEINSYLNENPYLNSIFLFLAIVAIIMSILFYLKSRKEKKPVKAVSHFHLVKDSVSRIDELKILFKGKEIPNLTLTKLALWNKGNDTINKEDVASVDPLRIEIDERYEILQAKLLFTKKEANNFQINQVQNKIKISFDYFHKNEGVVIGIYHTGPDSGVIRIKGTIKGVERIKQGIRSDDYILDSLFLPVVDNISAIKFKTLKYFLFVLFFFVFLPCGIVLSPIDKILNFLNIIPKEFDLVSDDEGS